MFFQQGFLVVSLFSGQETILKEIVERRHTVRSKVFSKLLNTEAMIHIYKSEIENPRVSVQFLYDLHVCFPYLLVFSTLKLEETT